MAEKETGFIPLKTQEIVSAISPLDSNAAVASLLQKQIEAHRQAMLASQEEAIRLERLHQATQQEIEKKTQLIAIERTNQELLATLIAKNQNVLEQVIALMRRDPINALGYKIDVLLSVIKILSEQQLSLLNRQIRENDKETMDRLYGLVENIGKSRTDVKMNVSSARDSNIELND